MKQEFQQELRKSLYVHRPLPMHRERELESRFPGKRVLDTQVLYGAEEQIAQPTADGTARVTASGDTLTMCAPLRADHWPEGAAPDGDYSNFGTARMVFSFPSRDWRGYNRLRFQVLPKIRGARILHLNVSIVNRGEVNLPDPYFREGATVFDLEEGKWNDCIWEFNAMARDGICQLCFYVFCSGHDIGTAEELEYSFRDIRVEQVENPEHEKGWVNPAPGIRLSTVGYWPDSVKTAVGTLTEDSFRLVRSSDDAVMLTGTVEHVVNARGEFDVMDFSQFTQPGEYYLQSGQVRSSTFEIGEDIEKESIWKVLNYFFCERCGFPVPGKHSTCHQDIIAEHNGMKLSFGGGWHDAGDVSQQAVQSGEIVLCLMENARKYRDDEMLYLRLMEEAQWGLDFILRTRFGDGFRATSAGATRITDNLMGTFDDIPCRVHDHAYENFLFSGIEAYAAGTLMGYDDALASNALRCAREDYGFAVKKFAETGVDPAQMYEHTYNSGLSQYYAVMCWAASCLFDTTHDEAYAADARRAAANMIACQETGSGAPLAGFFYRDESHSTIVHFNHQSRDYQFMQALDALCRSQPEHPERANWERSMRLFGSYLKSICGSTAPYGMLPAGIHRRSEIREAELFPYLHVTCVYEQEKDNYAAQLDAGQDLGDGFVLRNFPVWFSFRGNSAVMLATGKAAAIVGNYFGDRELLQLGREQLYWMWGKNPFGQGLVYGVGSDYCRQYAVLCGECAGEVPVGIETLDNEDVPYWPQNNNATFREVWVGAACRFLMLCAECGK